MSDTRNIAPVKLELFIAVVKNKKAAYYTSIVQSHQVNMQFHTPASGVNHLILNSLGLSGKPRTLIIGTVREDEAKGLIDDFSEKIAKGDEYNALAFTVPLSSIIGTLVFGFLSNEKTTVDKEA